LVTGLAGLLVVVIVAITTTALLLRPANQNCDALATPAGGEPWVTRGEFGPIHDWEGNAMVEPAPIVANGTLHLFYRAGKWPGAAFIGHATLEQHGWVRSAIPLFRGAQPWVRMNGGAFEVWYSTDSPHGGDQQIVRALSTDGVVWSAHAVTVTSRPAHWKGWGNRCVHRGVLYQDSLAGATDPIWTVGVYTTSDAHSYAYQGELKLPRRSSCAMYGGITLQDLGVTTKAWYHTTSTSDGKNLPTEIVSATSADMVFWENFTVEVATPYGYDQSADPVLVTNTLFYDVDDNVARSARIRWATRAYQPYIRVADGDNVTQPWPT
jgi:hypothetical protein